MASPAPTLRGGAVRPARDEIAALAARGNVVPVYREILPDLDTAVSAFLKLHPGPYGFLLVGVDGDKVAQTILVVSHAPLDGRLSPEAAYDHAVARIDALVARLRAPLEEPPRVEGVPGEVRSNFTQEAYEGAVRRAKEYIRAGD